MATQRSGGDEMKDFSFFNEEEKIKRAEEASNRRAFITKITLGASAVALTAYGANYGVKEWIESNRLKKIAKVKEVAQKFKDNKVIDYLKDYKKTIDASYSKNATDLLEFGKYKDLITAFKLKMNYGLLEKTNNGAYTNAVNSYKDVLDNFQKIIQTSENEALLKEAVEDNKFMDKVFAVEKYVSASYNAAKAEEYKSKIADTNLAKGERELANLNNEISGELKNVVGVKEEMMATIMSKISSGDYNLNATQKALTSDILESTNSELKDLQSVRETVKNSEFDKDFTENDLAEAKESLEALESSLVARIVEDKQSIEKMIAKVSNGETLKPGDAGAAASAASPLVANNTTASSSNSSWGAFEYYLLYNWLSGGSRTTPAMAAAHTSAFANTSGRNLQKENGNYVAPVMASASGSRQLSGASSSLYNPRVPNSYLSNSIPQKAITHRSGISPFQAKQKIESIKSRGRQATQARQASIARAQAARAQAARASSSSSRSSFSSGGRGGGGSGG